MSQSCHLALGATRIRTLLGSDTAAADMDGASEKFCQLGGYLETLPPSTSMFHIDLSGSNRGILEDWISPQEQLHGRHLVHTNETSVTLLWTEDVRLFHQHLRTGDGR